MQLELNGKWKMKRADQNNWLDAQVPGSVYGDLLAAGQMEDPFYRDNEYKILELSSYDYEYQRSFTVPRELLLCDRLVLHCDGLDTLSEISVNGTYLASTANMHRIYEFDLTGKLSEGENTIHILFKSPVEYATRKQKEHPLENSSDAVEGISHIRKAHCMFGWDWGPKLPDMGIWRNISILGFQTARLEDVHILQKHSPQAVQLEVDFQLKKWSETGLALQVEVTGPDGFTTSKVLAVEASTGNLLLEIEHPQLWWPNNFGSQPLYSVKVSLLNGDAVLDSKEYRIGLRTMEVRREKDTWGESFCFVVNGVDIFAMGADYIPEDNLLSRCSREKTEKLIRSCIAANFNSIRVWGGGYYPEDYFYELCDEYGLIVWQDLMFACGVYELTPDFKENITREVIDNARRLRHHASLGLWCGNNEQEWGWVEWGWSERCSPKLKADYLKQFEILFPELFALHAPENFYWPASPSSTGSFDKPNDQNCGDMHYWGVWHGKEPFTAYRSHFPRFMSEFGLQSFPSLKTVETFTKPEDRNIFSYVMESHQKNASGNEKILYYIADNYKYPGSFSSLLYASQLIQAEGLRYGVEHWRRNRGRCMGAVYWQLNDCWPVASWASIDYFGRWKALHYSAKKFFAPVMASACEEGTQLTLHVSNETRSAFTAVLSWRLMDARSRVLQTSEKTVTVAALSSVECEALDFSDILDTVEKQRNSYVEFVLTANGETVSSGTVLFVKSKHFSFADPQLQAEVTEEEDRFVIQVTAGAFAKFVELEFSSVDAIFEDNYFDLSAGTVKRIYVSKKDISKPVTLEELNGQLTLRSLFDTWEK